MKAENILYDIFLLILYICQSLTFIKFSEKILETKEIKDKKTDKIIKISASVVFIIFSCFLSMYSGPLRFFVKYISFVLACILYLKCFYITSFIESSVISLTYFLMFYFIYANCGLLENLLGNFLNISGIWWDIVLSTIVALVIVYFVITKLVTKCTDCKEYKLNNKEYSLLLLFCLVGFINYLIACYQYGLWILVTDYVSVTAIIVLSYDLRLIKSKEKEKELIIKQNIMLEEQDQLLQNNEKEKYKRFKASVEADKRVREVYNDLLYHFDYLLSCENDIKKIRDYIFKLKKEIKDFPNYFCTGNSILDLLLEEKCKEADKFNIKFKVRGSFLNLERQILEPRSISIIFGNLIDNAIKAASEVPEDQYRMIDIIFYQDSVSGLKIIVMNTAMTKDMFIVNRRVQEIKNDREDRKKKYDLVVEEVENYNGSIDLFAEEYGIFKVDISIPVWYH